MGTIRLDTKTGVAMTENVSQDINDQILDLDQRLQSLVAACPAFFRNKNLLRLYVLIVPSCLCAAVTLGFDAR